MQPYIRQAALHTGKPVLAEALKVPRFLEVCAYVPNVVPCGPGPAREIWEQDLFEEELSKLLAG